MTDRLPRVRVRWILATIGICLVNVALGAAVYAGIVALLEDADTARAVAEEDFMYAERAYDINPGQALVLYTNYACPFCAGLYEATSEVEVVTRILLIDNQSDRFATQDVVSPYMLKLSRVDEDGFTKMQAVLYGSQDEWTGLSDGEVLAWLNRQSGQTWSAEELAAELDELEELENEAPRSLLHVPALYLNDNKIL